MSKKVQDNDRDNDYNFEKKKNKQHWRDLSMNILQVLKKSITQTNLYSKNLFENEQAFIRKLGKVYLQQLKKRQQVKFSINLSKIFFQLKQKLLGISQLTFPNKEIKLKPQICFKNKHLQKFFNLLMLAYGNPEGKPLRQEIIITSEILRSVIQQDSKLNCQQDLFILKAFIIGEDKNKYSLSQPIRIPNIPSQKVLQTVEIKINAIHSYYVDNSIDIILSNIPSLGNVKQVYQKSIVSDEIVNVNNHDFQFNVKRMLGDLQDNHRASQNCFKYLGHAMELQFFNSLVQPISIQRFLNYFSISENLSLCRGLILGALSSLMKEDYVEQFSDSDDEYSWETQIQQICKQFCNNIFDGYFQGQQQSKEVTRIGRNIWQIKKQNHKYIYNIVQDHWLS